MIPSYTLMSPDPVPSQYSLTVSTIHNTQCYANGKNLECSQTWRPNRKDQYSMEVDFLSPQTICGLEYTSMNSFSNVWDYALEFEELVSDDKVQYRLLRFSGRIDCLK